MFIVFFGIGSAVLAATLLCDTLIDNFYLKGMNKQQEVQNEKLMALIADYDTLLAQLEGDPCQLARLAPATLGFEPNEPNTAFPRATIDKLAAARRALSEQPNQPTEEEMVPKWLKPCCRWPRRHILFISGATLILISFVFFGPTKRPSRPMVVTSSGEQPVTGEAKPAQNDKAEPPKAE